MGCCNTTEQVKCSNLKPQLDLDNLSKSEASVMIEQLVNSSINSFELSVNKKVIPKRPLNLIEFEQVLKLTLNTEIINFDNQIGKIPERFEILAEYKKFKHYLISKCKSREGFFRYLNNFYSFKLVCDIKREIISDFQDGKLTFEEGISKYKRSARGTFIIYGLQTLYELLKIENKDEVLKIMNKNAERIFEKLEDNRIQLERASRKAILPLNIKDDLLDPIDDFVNPHVSFRSHEPISRSNSIEMSKNKVYDEIVSKTSETNGCCHSPLNNQFLGV